MTDNDSNNNNNNNNKIIPKEAIQRANIMSSTLLKF